MARVVFKALQSRTAEEARRVCACACVCVHACACLSERKRGVCAVCQECVRVCSALRGGRLRLSQREVGRLATR